MEIYYQEKGKKEEEKKKSKITDKRRHLSPKKNKVDGVIVYTGVLLTKLIHKLILVYVKTLF